MHSFFNIKNRIIVAFVIVASLVVFVGAAVIIFGIRNEATFRTFADADAPRYVTLVTMRELVTRLSDDAGSFAKLSHAEDRDSAIKGIITRAGQIEQLYESYRALGADTETFSRILEQKERLISAVVNYRLLLAQLPAQSDIPAEEDDTVENNTASTVGEVSMIARATPSVASIQEESALLEQYISDAFESERILQEQSGQKVSSSVTQTNTLMSLGTVLIIVVLAGIVLFFRKWIWHPLGVLREVSIAIAKGDNTATADLASRDEIGDVARAFNLMLLRVRHAKQEIDEKAKKLSDTLLELGHLQKQTGEERALYELLLVSIGDAVLVVDSSLDVTLTNEHTADILKKDKEQIVATKITALFDLSYRDSTKSFDDEVFWKDVFTRKEPVVFQNELLLKDARGINIPVEMVVAPVIGEDKKVQSLVVTFRDITDMVRLEEARVSFVSAASHQLRTPLSSMRWFTEMLLDGDLGVVQEKQKEALMTFSESTLRMIALVNALLQLSRVEARRVAINPVSLNIIRLAEEVAVSLAPEAEKKKQTIIVHPNAEVLDISLDKELVWQAIMNYLTNALRYGTAAGTVEVVVTTDKQYLTVSVINDGIGIPEEAQARIFEKFYRASNAQKEVPNGNGIGLSFVKTIVEDWGGTVGFSSKPSEKTSFWFTIPLKGMKARKGEVSLAV